MDKRDLMSNPSYAPLFFQIESRILAVDGLARSRGLAFTDSQIRSTLIKVRKAASGGTPHLQMESARDQLLAGLYEDLVGMHDTLQGLSTEEWSLALQVLEESIRTRTGGPGSRDYLDFLEGFLPQAGLSK
jgi:hypothetical protein